VVGAATLGPIGRLLPAPGTWGPRPIRMRESHGPAHLNTKCP